MKPSEKIRHNHHPECLFVSDESAGCECGANEIADEVAALEQRVEKLDSLPDALRLRIFAEAILEDPPLYLDEVAEILLTLAAEEEA